MKKTLTMMAMVSLLAACAMADTVYWTGAAGDGLWFTAGNWSSGTVPNIGAGGDDVLIENGTCEYVPGGDWMPATTITIGDGGKWFQSGGAAWPNITGTVIVEEGGEIDFGTAGRVRVSNSGKLRVAGGIAAVQTVLACSGDSQVIVTGGELSVAGTLERPSVLNVTGGAITLPGTFTMSTNDVYAGGAIELLAGELRSSTDITISGTEFTVPLIAPQVANKLITVTGGGIISTGTAHDGFYSQAINFTSDSTGYVLFRAKDPSDAYSTYFASGKIRYEGATVSSDNFATLFIAEAPEDGDGGVKIYLTPTEGDAPVFDRSGLAVSGVTMSGATLSALVAAAGSPAATVYALTSLTNGGAEFAAWDNVEIGAAVSNEVSSIALTGLVSNTLYHCGMFATNSVAGVFAPNTPLKFLTGEISLSCENASASEAGGAITISIARPDADSATSADFSVAYTIAGIDAASYTASSASPVTIPAGTASVDLVITGVADWISQGNHDFTVALAAGPYVIGESNQVSCTFTNAELPGGVTNVFLGTVSSDASNAANWSQGVPTGTSVIYYSAEICGVGMTWDAAAMPAAVAGWVQPSGGNAANFCVTFKTTAGTASEPAKVLTISGDALLEGGVWKSERVSAMGVAPTHAINVSVGGDMVVGAAAEITVGNLEAHVNDTKYMSSGYYGSGHGYCPFVGGTYAGEGGCSPSVTNTAFTYGKVLDPREWGASGLGDGFPFAGAGLILLNVGGTLTVDGTISANGFGWPLALEGSSASSGGTINITAGRLLGAGKIAADGGEEGTGLVNAVNGSGSGGRIAIVLSAADSDFGADFTGAVSAYGAYGNPVSGVSYSASGTIAIADGGAGRDRATVYVDNDGRTVATEYAGDIAVKATHLPAQKDGQEALTQSSWVVRNYGAVRLTANAKVFAFELQSDDALLMLDGNTLRTKSLTVGGVDFAPGVYHASDFDGGVDGEGAIEVLSTGTLITIR